MAGQVRVQRAERIGKALCTVACLAAFCGTALVVLWARAPDAPVAAELRDPSRIEVLPSTIAPLATTTPDTTSSSSTTTVTTTSAPPTTSRSTTTPATEPPATEPLAPPTTGLADLLPPIDRGAALPEARDPRVSPISIENSVFDTTRYPIRPIGLEADGQLEIPDETEIGWYRYGATAGAPGATVLAAHVSWNNTTGPFFELGQMDPGDQISVTLDDGSARHYEVIERARYEKEDLPRERMWRNTGPESLVLITCGGDFNPEIRRYDHNIVVYAVPVG